jgi:hypothetical protein
MFEIVREGEQGMSFNCFSTLVSSIPTRSAVKSSARSVLIRVQSFMFGCLGGITLF